MKRFLWLGTVAALFAICSGCGEVFRPIIIPNPQGFPNPQAAHTAVTISDNGTTANGGAMVIDVSGDANVSQTGVGLRPVHGVQQAANEVLVLNQAVAGKPQDSVIKLNFNGTVIASTTTISLPISYDQSGNQTTSQANFVATTESSQAYVALPQYQPNPGGGAFIPSVAVVNTSENAVTATIPVGTTPAANPIAIVETPNGRNLYVANQGDGTISAFNTIDRSKRGISGSLTTPPIWLSARTDSQRVYVLESNGTLAFLDTTTSAGPDSLTETGISVLGASYMWYDVILNRLYIPGGNQTAVIDVSQSAPRILTMVQIPPVPLSQRGQTDVCSTFAPTAVTAAAVSSLPDGSRAYVGSFAAFEVDLTISNAVANGDGTSTYTYTLQSGSVDLLPGMAVTISGVISTITNPSAFNGTFGVLSAGGGQFKVQNSPSLQDTYVSGGSGAAPNVCPQATVITTSNNTIKSSIAIPGFPGYSFCADPATTRFRMMMAAGGDSTRAYLASCDGGNVNIIDTSVDTYILNVPAPFSVRSPIPPNQLNPPQNPVFMIAGP